MSDLDDLQARFRAEADSLAKDAHRRLCRILTEYGNVLSAKHSEGLVRMLRAMSEIAFGVRDGRWAVPLDPGLGKSQGVAALIASISGAGLPLSLTVACSQVKELVSMHRQLVANGVPTGDIGLLHSFRHNPDRARSGEPGYAELPSIGNEDSRQFMLATHVRVREVLGSQPFMRWRGQPRSLLVWDESLFSSDVRALTIADVLHAQTFVRITWRERRKHEEAVAWIRDTADKIERTNRTGRAATLERLDSTKAAKAIEALKANSRHPYARKAAELIQMGDEAIEVFRDQKGADSLVTYRPCLPEELNRVVVLDASYPIRYLEQHDRTIREVKMPTGVKTYRNLTIKLARIGAGRVAMEKDFTEGRRMAAETVRLLCEEIPSEQSALIFTFKQTDFDLEVAYGRRQKPVDFVGTLVSEMNAAGLSDHLVKDTATGKPRINLETWGREVATSDYRHCAFGILAGVLHKPRGLLGATIAGQRGMKDFTDDQAGAGTVRRIVVSAGDIARAELTEAVHSIFQAINRLRCRVVNDGEAATATVWLPYYSTQVREELEKVLPGARWVRWKAAELSWTPTGARTLTALIDDALDGFAKKELPRVSVKDLKQHIGGVSGSEAAKKAFTRAIEEVLQYRNDWWKAGRSLKRVTAEDLFGAPETL